MRIDKEFKITADIIEDCLEESLEKIVPSSSEKYYYPVDVL